MTSTLPSRKYKRLTAAEWAQAETYWKAGSHTLEEIAGEFGITTRALQAHFKKHGVAKSSEAAAIVSAARASTYELVLDDYQQRADRARLARSRAVVNAERIEGFIMAQLAEAERDPSSAFKAQGAIKMAALAMQTVERAHSVIDKALNVTEHPDELPTIRFLDFSDDDINAIKASQDLDEEDGETVEPEPNEIIEM